MLFKSYQNLDRINFALNYAFVIEQNFAAVKEVRPSRRLRRPKIKQEGKMVPTRNRTCVHWTVERELFPLHHLALVGYCYKTKSNGVFYV